MKGVQVTPKTRETLSVSLAEARDADGANDFAAGIVPAKVMVIYGAV
jgi:hypothetical protein